VRGRLNWSARVRPLNLTLAFIVCGVALLLATPLVSFNAISTRDQVSRLESRKVTPEQFDWRALAFDFGQPGRNALKRLQASSNPVIKTRANEVAKAERRWDVKDNSEAMRRRTDVMANARVLPKGTRLPESLRDVLAEGYGCVNEEKCSVLIASPAEALVFRDHCFVVPAPQPAPTAPPSNPDGISEATADVVAGGLGCRNGERYTLNAGKWQSGGGNRSVTRAELQTIAAAYAAGRAEIRTVPRRQVYIGGVPVGDPFE
jgi:hypothetical protein